MHERFVEARVELVAGLAELDQPVRRHDPLERVGDGLVKFGKPGDEFDPRFHEALMHAHSKDVTTTTCQDIASAGYMIGERVVRPARVTVVDPEPEAPTDGGQQ